MRPEKFRDCFGENLNDVDTKENLDDDDNDNDSYDYLS